MTTEHQILPGARALPGAAILSLCFLFAILLGGSARAFAGAIPAADGLTLILDIRVGSKADPRLRSQLIDWLQRRGLAVVAAEDVAPSFETCTRSDCLRAAALRAGAQRVLSAHINESNQVTLLWLFDVGSGLQHQVLQEWSRGDLWQSLTQTTEHWLRPRPDAAAHESSLGARLGHMPGWRRALAVGLGGLGILGLTIAVGAASKHGDLGPATCRSGGAERACFYDTQSLFGPTFALSALSFVGAALTLTLPVARPSRARGQTP